MSKELEALERILKEMDGCFQCDEFSGEISDEFSDEIIDDIDLIIQAIQRNEPMKPIENEEDFMSYDNGDNIDNQPSMRIKVCRCPKCNNVVGKSINFCHNCGQKLDWRNEDEL